jgi:hypothetical protein
MCAVVDTDPEAIDQFAAEPSRDGTEQDRHDRQGGCRE